MPSVAFEQLLAQSIRVEVSHCCCFALLVEAEQVRPNRLVFPVEGDLGGAIELSSRDLDGKLIILCVVMPLASWP